MIIIIAEEIPSCVSFAFKNEQPKKANRPGRSQLQGRTSPSHLLPVSPFLLQYPQAREGFLGLKKMAQLWTAAQLVAIPLQYLFSCWVGNWSL